MNEYTKRLYEYLSQDSAFAEKYKSPLEFSSALQNKEYAGRMRDYLAQDSAFAEKYPDVDSFYNAISVKKKEQPQQKTFGQPYSPSSQEPTQVSKTDSEGIDFGVYPTVATPKEDIEAVSRAVSKTGVDVKEKAKPKAVDWLASMWNSALDGVSNFSTNIRTNSGLSNETDMRLFIEQNQNLYPELYKSYKDNEGSNFAATASFMSLPRDKQFEIGEKLETFKRKAGKESTREAIGFDVEKDSEQKIKENFFGGALTGLAESIPAMLTSAPTMGMSFFDMAYQGADESLKQIKEEKGLSMSRADEEAYKLTIGATNMALERLGLSGVIKGTSLATKLSKYVGDRVFARIAKEGGEKITKELFDKIVNEEASAVNQYIKRVGTGFLAEAETGTLQQLSQDLVEQGINAIQGRELFDDKTAAEIAYDAIYAGAQEGIGGGLISSVISIGSKETPTNEEKAQFLDFVGTISDVDQVGAVLDEQFKNNIISKDKAKRTFDKVKAYKEALDRIPEEVSPENKLKAVELIQKRNGLQEKLAKADEAFKPKVQEKIDEINGELAKMAEPEMKRRAEEKAKSDAEDEAFFEQMVEGGASEASRVISEEEARLSSQADAEVQSIMAEEEAMAAREEKEAARKQAISEAAVTGETMAVERSTKPSKREGDKAAPKDLTRTEGEQDFTEAERPTVVTSLPAKPTPEQEKVQGMVAKAKEALAKKREQDKSNVKIEEAVVTPPTVEVSEELGPDVDYVTDDELADAMVQGAETPSVGSDKILSILDKAIEATSGKGKAFDATLGLPLFAVNSALKIARAVYVGGKSLAEAAKRAHSFLKSQGYDVDYAQFEKYIKDTLTGKKETDAVQEREDDALIDVNQNPQKYGYHGGSLKDKSDYLRATYRGDQPFTGHYFFSDKERAIGRGNRSVADSDPSKSEAKAVDFSKYNLLKPTTNGYWALKSGLKTIEDKLLKGRDIESEIERLTYFVPEVGNWLNENKDDVQSIFEEWTQIKNENLKTLDGRVERFETYLLKKMGYEGIDVRGLKEENGERSPDTSSEGSVIFDIKEGTVIDITPKQQTDAVQERETEGVLQREQEKAGEAGGERGGMEQQEQGQEAAEESEQEGKPQVAKDKKGFKGLLEKVFGLKGKKASDAATISDRIVGTIAERAGITKEEAYRRLGMIKADKALQEKIMKNPAILFQIMAFHGSPYEFEKFLTSQIGTGEGAQAFGWGLYFTDLESIAREYAIRLTDISKKAIISSPKNAKSFKKFVGDFFNNKNPYEKFFIKELDKYEELLRDGNTAKDVSDGMENYLDFKNNEVFRLQKIIDIFEKYSTDENATKEIIVNKLKSEISEAKESLSKHSKEWKGRKAANRIIAENGLVLEFLETKSADDVFDVFKEFRDELNLTLDEKRKLYKVSLHKGKTPDQYTWLEWDKGVDRKLISLIKSKLTDEQYKKGFFDTVKALGISQERYIKDGETLYNALTIALGSDKAASLFLLENGIDGIKYPAESVSRGATSDTARGFNYVVFDENAVSIEEVIKFQKDAIAARGAMMMGMDAQAVLYALTDPNVSTPLHELAHVYEHYLTDEERATIEAASGAKAGTTEFSEYFARGFEKYLSEGVAPDTGNEKTNKSLQKVFDNFKKWLTDIYNGITGSDIDVQLNDEMRSIYDQMLQGDTRSDAEKRRAERESLKKEIEGNQSLQDKVAAFRNFNPEHSYTTAQIELLKDFIKKFKKSGSLLGAGSISQVINGVADAANTKQKAKAGFKVKMFGKTLNVADLEKLAIGDVGIFLNKIFGDGYEKISAKIGFVGVGDAISKSLSNTNNWIANVREFTTKLPRKEKNITSVIKRDYVGIVEQMYHRFKDDLGEAEAIKFGIELIGLSIENQEAANKNTDTIKRQREVYELIKDVKSYDELLNVLSETERGLYEAVIKANSVGYDEIMRLSFDNGKSMERAERYLHIPVKKISEAKKLKELTPDEFEKDPSAVNMLNPFPENFTPKTTGAQEKRVEEADKLKKSFKDGSSYFDIGFEVTQLNSFLRTQMAVRLYQPIVKMNTFLSAKEAIEIFGGVKNDGANNIRVFKELAKYNINADSISKVSLSSLYGVGNVIMKLKRLAVPWLMGNPIQIVKQGSIEVATAARIAEILGAGDAAAMMYRRKDLIKTYLVESRKGKGTLISPDVNNLPWKDLLSQATIWVRNTLEANEFYDNMRDIKMSMNIPLKGWYNKATDFWMDKWVTSTDKYGAQVAWLSFYEAYLVKNNLLDQSQFYDNDGSFDMNKWLDWIKSEGKNPNKDAMAFATTETRLIHGPSTIYERAMIQHDLNTDNAFINTAYRMVKDMTLPLSVMSMSMSYTQLMSMIKLSSSKYSLKDKKAAAAQLTGLAASIGVFQGVSSFIWPVMKQAVVKTFCESIGIDGDDEDELLGKIKVLYKTPEDFNKSVGIFMTNTFVESLIPFAATSDRAKYYIAKGLSFTFYSIGQSVYGKEYDAKYGKYGFESFDIWYQTKDLKPQAYKPRGGVGYFGFVPEIIYDNYKIGEAGITGRITDEYTGQELYLTEEQKAQSMNIWGLHTLGIAIPFAPAMTTQVAKSSFYELKDLTTDNQIEAIKKEWDSLSEEDKKEFAERTARKMSEYFTENREKFARDWGVEMSTIKTLDKFSSDIKKYNNKTYMEMAFSVMNGEEKVNPNSVDQFLVRTAREHIPIKAKAIKLYNRLNKFEDPKDRKEYAARIANSSTFLYPEDALIALQFNFRRLAELDKESDSGR